jgi:hypothetical protein
MTFVTVMMHSEARMSRLQYKPTCDSIGFLLVPDLMSDSVGRYQANVLIDIATAIDHAHASHMSKTDR